jgi:hypothetical protein
MVIKVLIALVVIAVVFVIVVSTRPPAFRYTRSTSISAPASVVFAQVNDLHKWEAWSPWAKMDPNAKSTFAGPSAGTGAAMSWAGNRNVGEGRMTITESRPSEFIRFRLDFLKPFAATNTGEFTFQPQGSQTLVTWSMFGPNSFMGKAVNLFINCEKMVGGQFEKGLADLKSVSEASAKK